MVSLIVLVHIVVCIIMAVSSLVVLTHTVIDGGWFVVGILISGLFSNKYIFVFTEFSRIWSYRQLIV